MEQTRRVIGLAVLGGLALLGGCFDTRIIPAEPSAEEGGAGAAGKRAATAGSGPSGGSLGAGSSAGGAPDTASSGQGGDPSSAGVTWLSLQGSQAPSTEAVNGALGINGALYGYKDACATLKWDPVRRCASGRLCTTGANFENWGVAVGFDFVATGPDGSPPDSKLVWDPDVRDVRGVTWQVSGHAPGLQVWVLNMDPVFRGECSQQTCEIAGPPDGAAAASLQGSLLFDQMVKDNWGGRGVAYSFDPTAVYALQFKLPAINVGSASFDFCIEALGVIR